MTELTRLREFAERVRDRGLHADLNPTRLSGVNDQFWIHYLQGIDTSMRQRAEDALKQS